MNKDILFHLPIRFFYSIFEADLSSESLKFCISRNRGHWLMKAYMIILLLSMLSYSGLTYSQPIQNSAKDGQFEWIRTARVFLVDAYLPPFVPKLEYDAELLAQTMEDMHANVVRIGTMGKYATIQGIRFSTHPDQGNRDLLKETIAACKPRGIRVVPYISTGHKLAYSMISNDYPEYARQKYPNAPPERRQMFVGEDLATVCWMTPYRQAYWDYVEHVVRDYDIDGMYFDTWWIFNFWGGMKVCYCDGCQKGFLAYSGKKLPYHENEQDYTEEELALIEEYQDWYWEDYIGFIYKLKDMIKSYKDVPIIFNIVNPKKIAKLDPRIIPLNDAVLYERGQTILERAEGVSLALSLGFGVWPYVGVYNQWPRVIYNGYLYQQQILINAMFGAGSIVAQPYAYTAQTENRRYVSDPFRLIETHENDFVGFRNYPFVAVVYGLEGPKQLEQDNWWWPTNSRTASLGAFAGCLYNHIQVSSIHEKVLDDPDLLSKYRVLYLADIMRLNQKQIENVKDFVREGGGLVASFGTSLYDNDMKEQQQFGLEELIHVHPLEHTAELDSLMDWYDCMLGGPDDLYLLANNQNSAKLGQYWENRLVPLWFYKPVRVMPGGTVLMDIVTGDGHNPILPGLVISNYGKGKVIYSASALESLYFGDRPYILGDLIRTMVGLVEPEPAPYTLEAPASLITNLTQKENRWVIHLTNWTGNKFEKDRINEYYLAPVENVRLQIHIPEGKKVSNVSTLVKADFKKKITGQNLEMFFPRIESYQAVEVDFE